MDSPRNRPDRCEARALTGAGSISAARRQYLQANVGRPQTSVRACTARSTVPSVLWLAPAPTCQAATFPPGAIPDANACWAKRVLAV